VLTTVFALTWHELKAWRQRRATAALERPALAP
jgi:hypothetical protein